MVELVLIGVVAGLLAAVSPCILPVLPVILMAGATGTPAAPAAAAAGAARQQAGAARAKAGAPAKAAAARAKAGARPGALAAADPAAGSGAPGGASVGRSVAVVLGLALSFSVLILAGSEIISLLHLPADSLRDAGIALLILVGLGYLIRPLGALLERPFARVTLGRPVGGLSGFVLGLALGVVYVPCAGPVLAAITVIGATGKVGLTAVFVTIAFAVGTAVPLLVVALAGRQLSRRLGSLRRHAPRVRLAGGAVMVVVAVAIAFNTFDGLQKMVPGYSTALQTSAGVRTKLNGLSGTKPTKLTKCTPKATLIDCGAAPAFTGITTWLNTPGGRPLTMAGLRGKVVLVDFWTYSCINCQRTLPHLEAWASKYKKDGLVIVGVHTPEFAFEHVVSNVRAEAAHFGVNYPVAVDNNYGTWNAYDNEYWPADYLIDAQGNVRHVNFGEGDYGQTEQLIRSLLVAAKPGVSLPKATSVPDKTPTEETNPETYVGYERLQYLLPSPSVTKDKPAQYQFPQQLPLGGLGLSGTWTEHAEEATAGAGAKLELGFLAKDVYLVLSGSGTVAETINGKPVATVKVSGVPRLYTLFQTAGQASSGVMQLQPSPGVQVYDFTFG